ncbi:MAG: substrate-binding domain-containing protein, partial [Pseudomonadota bacterium]
QIFLALAREIIKDGKIVINDSKRWSEIDKSLPDVPIKIYGTPPVSGTYDTFIDLVMKKGCMQVPEFAAIKDEKERDRKCKGLREDGVFVEAGENGNLIAQKLIGDSNALGIIGFNFLDQNTGKLQGSIIDGQAPSFDAIQNAVYPISRPLFFYIKGENLSQKAAIKEYVREFLSEAAIGDEGYLINQGLIPLLEEERKQIRKNIFQEIGE